MNNLVSCKYESCKCKDTCKRYNIDSVVINFEAYYDNDLNKCLYYIQKDKENIK